MQRALVEPDGSILVPEELVRGAHLESGQELVVSVDDGVVTLSVAVEPDPFFPGGLDRALDDVRAGRLTRQRSDEDFVAALRARAED